MRSELSLENLSRDLLFVDDPWCDCFLLISDVKLDSIWTLRWTFVRSIIPNFSSKAEGCVQLYLLVTSLTEGVIALCRTTTQKCSVSKVSCIVALSHLVKHVSMKRRCLTTIVIFLVHRTVEFSACRWNLA